jgi:predicted membrane protein
MQTHSNQGRPRSGKILAGMVLLAVGIILMLRNLGYFFPHWLFSWPVILIVLGLFIGFRHNFRNPGGLILIAIGGLFLAEKLNPGVMFHQFIIPVVIMFFGLWMIFGRNRRPNWSNPQDSNNNPEDPKLTGSETTGIPDPDHKQYYSGYKPYYSDTATNDDYLEMTSIFGGNKRIVLSKNFRGGEVVTIMGGAEINFSQADIQGQAVLDVTQVMGGTKIIVPANWDVKSEMAVILGGNEDKRIIQPGATDPNKVLVIKGTSVLGGIDIHSY